MIHAVHKFNDDKFDKLFLPLEYCIRQAYPSPLLMLEYESEQSLSDAFFFATYKHMPSLDRPYSSWKRVCAYLGKLEVSKWIENV